MGRETKTLLALLATLGGVFFGVLSMKLLVPRPPAGAGPDVTLDTAGAGANELVEPPSLAPARPGPATGEPAPIATGDPSSLARGQPSRFTTDEGDLPPPPASFAMPAAEPPAAAAVAPDVATAAAPPAQAALPPPGRPATFQPRRDPFVAPAGLETPERHSEPHADQAAPATVAPPTAAYAAAAGDSWWGLAERAYGDGRLYRALFAWNRALDPRISLAPGTRLEIPPRSRLEAAWPKLMP